MIHFLNNSDWVKQGRKFFEQNNYEKCPFCQQSVNESLRQNLEYYFDITYEEELRILDVLQGNYQSETAKILSILNDISEAQSAFLDRADFEQKKQEIQQKINMNIAKISEKKKSPSSPINLDSTERSLNEISEIIAQANEKISQQNKILDNIAQEKKKLIDQIWSYFFSENIHVYNEYVLNKSNLEKQISEIKNSINEFENGSDRMKGLKQYNKIISDLEAQQSSDQFVIKEINKMLNGFGSTGFSLKAAEKKGFYALQRPNGTPAQQTLSEGEKTFIAFLYFYHLLKGSHNSNGIQDDKIVVFDDPQDLRSASDWHHKREGVIQRMGDVITEQFLF